MSLENDGFQYSNELVVWNRIKSFTKIEVYDVTLSITFVMSCKLIEKSEMLSQRRSLLNKAMLDIFIINSTKVEH